MDWILQTSNSHFIEAGAINIKIKLIRLNNMIA